MALQVMGEEQPNLGVVAKGPGVRRSPRPRSCSLACSKRLADLTGEAQAKLESLQAWLHSRMQSLRPLEVPGWKSITRHNMAAPLDLASSATQRHGTLTLKIHTALAERGLLPQQHALSHLEKDNEGVMVSVHEEEEEKMAF